jgi:uncharacterized protein YbjT (DUF2867 family)
MRATLIGATGLIGSHLLDLLLEDQYFDAVRILVRRPLEMNHPKLEKKLVNFSDQESFRLALEESDVIFCTIGTTQKKVKSDKEAYRKVDYDIAINAAQLGKLCGCKTFVLVSAVGANAKSNNFYLKLKGEIEEAVKAIGLMNTYFIRPSLLLGKRKEFRPGEKISMLIMPVFSLLIPTKFKPVHATDVAKAMIAAGKMSEPGLHILHFKEIKLLID